MSDPFNVARERLCQLVGNRLAEKLIEDNKKAAAVYAKNISDVTVKAFQDRYSLTADELTEPRFNLVRDEAVELLKSCISVFISCEVLNLSCVLHNALEVSMAAFVSHAVGHYEVEQKKRRIESIVEALIDNEPDENDIHHAAKAHSSGN